MKEYFVFESYLPGNFTEWCNNNGYWKREDQYVPLMQAGVFVIQMARN